MSEHIQMTTTTDSRELAHNIANMLMEKKLAACVQISGPITSIYKWKKKIENTEEWLCLIKTKKNHFPAVEETIKALHHYDVPEITVLPMGGSRDYLDWIDDVVKK